MKVKLDTSFSKHFKEKSIIEITTELDRVPNLLNFVDESDFTIFEWAILHEKSNIVQYLLGKLGANVAINSLGHTPIIYASRMRTTSQVFDIILNFPGINLLSADTSGWCAIHHAVNRNFIEFAGKLIQQMSAQDLLARTGRGRFSGVETPLHIAAIGGHIRIACMLIQKCGLNIIDLRDQNSQTPLHEAIKNQNTSMVKTLLILAANPAIRLQDGQRDKDCYELARLEFDKIENRGSSSGTTRDSAREILGELNRFRQNPVAYRQQALEEGDEPTYWVSTAKTTCSLL